MPFVVCLAQLDSYQFKYHSEEAARAGLRIKDYITDEERFLVRHDVCFTDALVDLVNTEDSTEVHNFNSHATKRVLRHALERVQEVLDPLKDRVICSAPGHSLRTQRWLDSLIP